MRWETGIEVLMLLHAVIGLSFLVIAGCIVHGILTSSVSFVRYVGLVFASFIGICGISRLAHGTCYALVMGGQIGPMTGLDIVIGLDLLDVVVGVAAAAACVWVVIYFVRHPNP